jgi:hypothetical protein
MVSVLEHKKLRLEILNFYRNVSHPPNRQYNIFKHSLQKNVGNIYHLSSTIGCIILRMKNLTTRSGENHRVVKDEIWEWTGVFLNHSAIYTKYNNVCTKTTSLQNTKTFVQRRHLHYKDDMYNTREAPSQNILISKRGTHHCYIIHNTSCWMFEVTSASLATATGFGGILWRQYFAFFPAQ